MGDAEIIPIGTRGRPGRGTGKTASSAARNLAGPTKKATAPSKQKPATTTQSKSQTPKKSAAGDTAESAASAEQTQQPAEARVSATTTRERNLLASISSGEWLNAFQSAAVEVFGDQWEPQLARFLAFLRRRITGEFVVDEYGFDAEITQRFFMAALRPLADSWFRVEVFGAENIPTEGGALVVSNHSGTVPVDGLMTMVSIFDHTGRHLHGEPERSGKRDEGRGRACAEIIPCTHLKLNQRTD